MSFIDLHVHTTASDGTYTPEEVVNLALKKELSVIAITDHDTVSGVESAMDAANGNKIAIVPGVEISCLYEKTEIHMLGLFIDWKNEELQNHLEKMRMGRENRNERMIEKMNQDGIPVTMEKLRFSSEDTVITRAHFARFLEQEGYVKSKDEAFKKYVGEKCPYYIPREYIPYETAIEWIHEAGGLAILAHPYLYGFKEQKVRTMIKELKKCGLDGLEAYHSSTNQGQTNLLREYAKQYALLVSGGSDFHGSNKPYVHLGVGKGNLKITDYVYEKLVNRQV